MIRESLYRALSVGLAAALALATAGAAAAGAAETGKTVLERVEDYLNGITTLRAQFVQAAHDGSIGEGTLYISRPGRLRLEYAPPLEILLVSDGEWLTYIDAEFGQVSHTALSSTPAGFLLRDEIRFGGDIMVTTVKGAGGVLRVTLSRAGRPGEGSLTLVFTDNPLELRQWLVVDPQGLETLVTLSGAQYGLPLDPKLFDAPSPFPDDDDRR